MGYHGGDLFDRLLHGTRGDRGARAQALPNDTYQELETFANVLAIVQKNYVEPVSTKDLIDGAITGMLASLDPHSAYLTPELYRDLEVETRGSFGGLGIEITIKNGDADRRLADRGHARLQARDSRPAIRSSKSITTSPRT